MKRWLILCIATLLWGRSIGWMGDYEAALYRARQEKKPLLIIVVKPGCEACNELLKKIARDEVLAGNIARSTIPLLLTEGVEKYPIEMYYTPIVPAIFLVDGQERFLIDPIAPASLSALRRRLEKEVFNKR